MCLQHLHNTLLHWLTENSCASSFALKRDCKIATFSKSCWSSLVENLVCVRMFANVMPRLKTMCGDSLANTSNKSESLDTNWFHSSANLNLKISDEKDGWYVTMSGKNDLPFKNFSKLHFFSSAVLYVITRQTRVYGSHMGHAIWHAYTFPTWGECGSHMCYMWVMCDNAYWSHMCYSICVAYRSDHHKAICDVTYVPHVSFIYVEYTNNYQVLCFTTCLWFESITAHRPTRACSCD
jgi:hypothetical protein